MFVKIISMAKGILFRVLKSVYGFQHWHLSPLESRPYAMDIIEFLNSRKTKKSVFEIGCGLGEIISSIDAVQRKGFDVDESVVAAAQFLFFWNDVEFRTGSFNEIVGHEVDYMILVNFTHDIHPSDLKRLLKTLTSRNLVDHLIVDEVGMVGYAFHHDFNNIVPNDYSLSKIFPASYAYERKVKIYSRNVE